jgi:hypothetical protein
MALGWPWGGLGVALGGFVQPSFRFQLSDFSFQLSAFQLLPDCGLGVALGGFAQPPFWFQLSAFSFSAFQLLPKCGFVQPSCRFQLSAFQLFSFCRNAALPGLSMLEVGCSMFDVRCSMFDVRCSVFTIMNPSRGPDTLPLPIYDPIFRFTREVCT